MSFEEELGFREKDISYDWETFEKNNFDKSLSYFKQFYRKSLQEGPIARVTENQYTLSEDQQYVYDAISKDIKQGLTHQQLYLVQSSQGCGKGILVETLYFCALRNGIQARIATLSGVAASRFPCLASTLHSSLSIPLGKTAEEIISMPVSSNVINSWKNVKLFFIDEIFLLSSTFLYIIHKKLQQIFCNSHPFGNISLVCLGDILQSMCIGGTPLYLNTESDSEISERGRKLYLSIKNVFMLTKNHRQKDKEYSRILECLKHNQLNPEDLFLINSRHERNLQECEKNEFHEALYIALKRDAVLNRNKEMLYKSEKPVMFTHARRFGAADGGIIPLYLAEGCPLILNENINVNMNLVNGSLGICRGIIIKDRNPNKANVFGSQKPKPVCVLIEFPEINGRQLNGNIFPIFPQSKNIERDFQATFQTSVFPLETFYAATIIKIQGKTLPKVIVKVEPWYDWAPFFVAMSRVSNLSDLMIVGDFYSPDLFPHHNRSYMQKMCELNRLETLAENVKLIK